MTPLRGQAPAPRGGGPAVGGPGIFTLTARRRKIAPRRVMISNETHSLSCDRVAYAQLDFTAT